MKGVKSIGKRFVPCVCVCVYMLENPAPHFTHGKDAWQRRSMVAQHGTQEQRHPIVPCSSHKEHRPTDAASSAHCVLEDFPLRKLALAWLHDTAREAMCMCVCVCEYV